MKNIFIISISLLLIVAISNCNQSEEIKTIKKDEVDSLKNITKLEKFLGKRGELFVKEFYEVGTVQSNTNLKSSIDITAIIIYNPGEEEKRIKGLKIEIKSIKYSTYSSYDESETVFLDMEELQGLVEAINYMRSLILKWEATKKEYTEVIYTTTGNFQMGFFMRENSKNTGELYGFAQAGYSKVSCYFNPDVGLQLETVKDIITKGINVLNEK